MSEVMGILAAAAGARALMDIDDQHGAQDENSQQAAQQRTPATAENSQETVSQTQRVGNDSQSDASTTSQAIAASSSQPMQSQPTEGTPVTTTPDTSRTEQPMDIDVASE